MDGDESGVDGETRRGGYLGFIEWLNERVYKAAGPPPSSSDPVVDRIGAATCPVCGRPMSEHTIDHSSRNAVLNCPIEHPHEFDASPLNELGMPKGPREG